MRGGAREGKKGERDHGSGPPAEGCASWVEGGSQYAFLPPLHARTVDIPTRGRPRQDVRDPCKTRCPEPVLSMEHVSSIACKAGYIACKAG